MDFGDLFKVECLYMEAKILIVEDEAVIVMDIENKLEKFGCDS